MSIEYTIGIQYLVFIQQYNRKNRVDIELIQYLQGKAKYDMFTRISSCEAVTILIGWLWLWLAGIVWYCFHPDIPPGVWF